jgi:hypothetical protein
MEGLLQASEAKGQQFSSKSGGSANHLELPVIHHTCDIIPLIGLLSIASEGVLRNVFSSPVAEEIGLKDGRTTEGGDARERLAHRQ